MKGSSIAWDREIPRQVIGETLKKDLGLMVCLWTWFTIGHYGVV